MGKFSQLLHNLLNDCVTTQHMGKFTHNMGKFTQLSHILCNDCLNTNMGKDIHNIWVHLPITWVNLPNYYIFCVMIV